MSSNRGRDLTHRIATRFNNLSPQDIIEWTRHSRVWKRSPITGDPFEWEYIPEDVCGYEVWQSWKNPSAFSYDGGKTYILLTDTYDPQKNMKHVSVPKGAIMSEWIDGPKLEDYVRKPLFVKAVQVTKENYIAVAHWCKGSAYEKADGHITVKVLNSTTKPLPRTKAFVGDWVLLSNNGFRVYTDSAFSKAFEKVPEKAGQWPLTHEDAIQLTFGTEE